jgi:hypothetical protein
MAMRLLVALILVGALVVPATAAAAGKNLWATVNVCDTANSPNTIGIRGSMPGSRDERETMWMRFQVEYLSDTDNRWHLVTEDGDPGFVRVGTARKTRQSGRSLRFNPNGGKPVALRGRVSFEWRLHGEAVRRASTRTRKGYESSAGADPPGYTAGTCTISP